MQKNGTRESKIHDHLDPGAGPGEQANPGPYHRVQNWLGQEMKLGPEVDLGLKVILRSD